jgi:hypothetical protein
MSETSGEKRLNADEAHEEANVLRASLNLRPEDGRRYFTAESGRIIGSESLTAQEYDRALGAIEELKRAAAEDPRKLANVVYDLMGKGERAMNMVFQMLDYYTGQMPQPNGGKKLSLLETISQRSGDAKYLTDLNTMFFDAKNELEFLKKKGEEFGDKEQQREAK